MQKLTSAQLRGPPSPQSPAQARPSLARPKPGPSLAQAWPRPDFWKFGNLEIWDAKKRKQKTLKIQIRSAQNVGRSRLVGKTSWPHLGQCQAIFPWTKHIKKWQNISNWLGSRWDNYINLTIFHEPKIHNLLIFAQFFLVGH